MENPSPPQNPVIPAGTPVQQASIQPTRKVVAATLGSAITVIVVFILNAYVLPKDQPITPEVTGAISTIFVLIAGYFIPASSVDQVIPK